MTKKTQNRLCQRKLAQLQLLLHLQKSAAEIAAVLKCGRTTVYYWVRRFAELDDEPYVPPPRKTAKSIALRRQKVVALACKRSISHGKVRPAHCTARSIAAQLRRDTRDKIKVSRHTVLRDLEACGFRSVVRPRVPTTAVNDHKWRMRFCRIHKALGSGPPLAFSDEKIFTTNDYTFSRMFVRGNQKPVGRERTRFPVRVMVWALIAEGVLVWHILPQKTTKRGTPIAQQCGTLTSAYYVGTILPSVAHLIRNGKLTFMQDGAAPHRTREVSDWLASKRVKLLTDWPARSPDLNPIETFWAIAQRLVAEENPQTYDELVSTVDNVFTCLKDHRMATISGLVASFRSRCATVYANKGLHQ